MDGVFEPPVVETQLSPNHKHVAQSARDTEPKVFPSLNCFSLQFFFAGLAGQHEPCPLVQAWRNLSDQRLRAQCKLAGLGDLLALDDVLFTLRGLDLAFTKVRITIRIRNKNTNNRKNNHIDTSNRN